MNVTASSVYDLKALKALNTVAMCRKMPPWLKLSLLPVVSTLLFLTLIMLRLSLGASSYDTFIICYLIFSYICSAFMIWIYFGGPKNQFKNIEKQGGVVRNGFLFDATGFIVNSENASGSLKSTTRIEYSTLVGVFETTEYLILKNTAKSGYIIEKSTFVGNEDGQLQQIFRNMFGKKYIKVDYI